MAATKGVNTAVTFNKYLQGLTFGAPAKPPGRPAASAKSRGLRPSPKHNFTGVV